MKKYYFLALFVLFFIPTGTFASAPALSIHAFQTAGDSAYDEFLSIENDGTMAIDLTNYSVSRKTKTGTSWNTLYKFISGSISPHQVLTVANPKYTGVSDFVYSTSSYSLTADNSIAILAPDKTVVDLVGYGEANTFRGTALPNPAPKEIFIRTQNTGNNLADFVSSVQTLSLDPNVDKVVISELMPNPAEGSEWFELYNETNLPVSLAGLKICDAMGSTHCYFFDAKETLAPNEYKTYSQTVTKITLNNDGDWLELRDSNDNVLTDSGGDYGNSDPGISLSLFGSEYQWTKSATPAAQNIYTDTAEPEVVVATKAAKTTTSKVKKTVSKSSTAAGDTSEDPAVLAAATDSTTPQLSAATNTSKTTDSNSNVLGYTLIALAATLLLGYNLWDKRKYVRDLYYKISRRNR